MKKAKVGRPKGSKSKRGKAEIAQLVDEIKQNLADKALDRKTTVSDKIAILNALRN